MPLYVKAVRDGNISESDIMFVSGEATIPLGSQSITVPIYANISIVIKTDGSEESDTHVFFQGTRTGTIWTGQANWVDGYEGIGNLSCKFIEG